MVKRAVMMLGGVVGLAACAAEMTPEGRMVRQIPNAVSPNCTFLGVVESRGLLRWDRAENRRHALNGIRDEVAALGGNAYSLSQNDVSRAGGARVQGNAYLCPPPRGAPRAP